MLDGFAHLTVVFNCGCYANTQNWKQSLTAKPL